MKKTISGIRGIFGEYLNLKDVLEFCNNFSSLIKSKKCVIGKDTRPSGSMIKNSASAALMKNGIDIFNLETVPTPVVFREARNYGAGLVISSSHPKRPPLLEKRQERSLGGRVGWMGRQNTVDLIHVEKGAEAR